jgi:O-glycosyl hydrolase
MKTDSVAIAATVSAGRWLPSFVFGLALLGFAPRAAAATVTVDGSQTFQFIDGFGVNLNHWNTNEIGPVIDALVDQAGMTLFRVIMDHSDWEATDTNSNPSVANWVMNWGYYNGVYSTSDFENLWDTIDYLNKKGITNGISLSFMGAGPAWLIAPNDSGDTFLIPGHEPQWAEMLTSLVLYGRNTCHLQFNLIEPNNEPDNLSGLQKIRVTQGTQAVTALEDLAECLNANGLSDIRFVGPDLDVTSTSWISDWLNDPLIMSKAAHVGLHSYGDNGGGSDGIYSLLQQSAYPSVDFWMTEFNVWCTTCEGGGAGNDTWDFARGTASFLLNHLANGAAGGVIFTGCDTWMDYIYQGAGGWSFWGLFAMVDTSAVPKTFTPRKGFYTLSQISKYVRPGAQQIGLSGTVSPFNLLAFYHPVSGQLTLTGVNPSSAAPLSASLLSLAPVPSLDLYYTTSSTNLSWGGSFRVNNGSVTAMIPADCVFTLVSPPRPLLTISFADGSVYISWPGELNSYQLQSATNPGPGSMWQPVTSTPELVNGQWTVSIQPLNTRQFFRLARQAQRVQPARK